MAKKTKKDDGRHGSLWTELQKKAKNDPELATHIEAVKRAIERYSDTLKQLADS
jgi:hypothetical protein